jgi:hypothetical protein
MDEDEEPDPDETPTEIVIEGIRQGLREALSGQTIPLTEMWGYLIMLAKNKNCREINCVKPRLPQVGQLVWRELPQK